MIAADDTHGNDNGEAEEADRESARLLLKLADAAGVPVEWFFEEANRPRDISELLSIWPSLDDAGRQAVLAHAKALLKV